MHFPWRCLLGVVLLGSPASAHFPFLVPAPDSDEVRILLSETLELDDRVPADLVLAGTYVARLADGSERLLEVHPSSDGAYADLSGELATASLLTGTLDLGFTQRGDGTPHLLVYYPKTLLHEALDPGAHFAAGAPIELTPVRADGGVQLVLSVDGVPEPEAEMVVILPDGSERELVTDADGRTEVLAAAGRYGAWARHWIDKAGVRDGQEYEQVRHYATLVFDHGAAPVAERTGGTHGHGFGPEPVPVAAAAPLDIALPEATSSFGAVQEDGWIYVYGGHVAPTHDYHTEAVSGGFWRIDMTGDAGWEELPGGPALQGMNLAAHDGLIYRVGGMDPRNAPGEAVDNWSVRTAERFDPAQRRWEELPPLPEARSSHDVAVVGGRLYVIGGWNMAGAAGNAWPDTMLVLDLNDPDATWRELPQPFRRRALIVAVHDHEIYVIGGFDPEDEPSRRVDVFDPREGRWRQGPGLPGRAMNGFAPAACVYDRQLYVSLGDGTVHRLDDRDYRWEQVGTNAERIVHRMVALGGRILVLGGASEGDNHDLIEELEPAPADGFAARTARLSRAAANARLAAARVDGARPSAERRPTAASPSAPVVTAPVLEAPRVVTAAVASFPRPESDGAAAEPSPGALAAAAVQTRCPLMTDEAVDATSFAVEYEGRTVLLCCESCVRKWSRDPARYAASPLLPQLAGLADESTAAR